MAERKGLFITLEGGEGTGKTTLAKKLQDYLENEGYKVYLTKEPGDTRVGKKIRELLLDSDLGIDPITEAYLFAADRAEHVRKVINPLLEDNYIVICDRYLGSNVAYQGYARDIGVKKVLDINQIAINDQVPDYTLFLDVDPIVGLSRIQNNHREQNRIDLETLEFHFKVYEGFKKTLFLSSKAVIPINGLPDADIIFEQAKQIMTQILQEKKFIAK